MCVLVLTSSSPRACRARRTPWKFPFPIFQFHLSCHFFLHLLEQAMSKVHCVHSSSIKFECCLFPAHSFFRPHLSLSPPLRILYVCNQISIQTHTSHNIACTPLHTHPSMCDKKYTFLPAPRAHGPHIDCNVAAWKSLAHIFRRSRKSSAMCSEHVCDIEIM